MRLMKEDANAMTTMRNRISTINLELFQKMIESLILTEDLSEDVIDHLFENYVEKYYDVTLRLMQSIA